MKISTWPGGRMTNGFQHLAFLKGSGVKDKDVQTDFISVEPEYDYNKSHVRPMAYIVPEIH